MSEKKKSTNPLYVVTNQGKDVEEASGLFDLLIKKLGISPYLEGLSNALNMLIELLVSQINSYPLLVEAQKLLEKLIYQIEISLARLGLGPVVAKK